MTNSLLKKKNLCFLSFSQLLGWLNNSDFMSPDKNLELYKDQWRKELDSNQPSFFIDSELIFLKDDIILLQLVNKNHVRFLTKTYQVKEQQICQKLFQENKNIVLLTEEQCKKLKEGGEKNLFEEENCFVLFKDEEASKESLVQWLESLLIRKAE